jgi:hypothetical protein
MNMSDLITRIKIACGIYAIALPFENPDEAIADVIRRVTLERSPPTVHTVRASSLILL